jgi:hypothetical protein
MRFILLVLFLSACSAAPSRIGQPDRLCVNDCLGAGGTREFCDTRCTD